MERMVRIFGDMGLVEVRDWVTHDPGFPATMMVASFGPTIQPPPAPGAGGGRAAGSAKGAPIAEETPKEKLPLPARQ